MDLKKGLIRKTTSRNTEAYFWFQLEQYLSTQTVIFAKISSCFLTILGWIAPIISIFMTR
jgi:hypothetical protein